MEFLFGTLLLVYSGNHFRNLMTNTNETAAELAPNGLELPPGNIRKSLSRLERRERWLWSTTVAVILLLTLGVASFAFPAMLSREQTTYSFYLNQAVRALVGLVLLFSVYLVYQRNLISKLRNELTDQMNSIAKVESLASEVYKLAALDQLTGIYNRR
jgi:cell division protein FtsL